LSAVTARPLTELVDGGWATALEPVAGQVAAMGDFLRGELASGRRYLPAGSNVLRAFTFPFERVRVLVVGQDPYPTPGHPVGLSFSVAADVKPLPRSLDNIFAEYSADLGYPTPSNGDLTPWAERGVMLLNRVLTVQPGNPASHRGKGWEVVTECAIRALATRPEPLVVILWGRDASTLKPMLAAGNSRIATIESAHPSPLSAQRGFFGSRPFSRANALLAEMGAESVDWRLP
jgi:uracil-DNA glycosylase